MDQKESFAKMNGRLSDHYKLYLISKQEESKDGRDSLIIKVKLIHDKNKDSIVTMTKKEAAVRLFINNKVVEKKNVDIDTSVYNELTLLTYKEDFLVKNSTLLILKAELEITDRDESEYLKTTEIRDTFILTAIPERKLFIDLDSRESSTLVFCTIETTLEPELLEYKTNFVDWEKLDTKQRNFSVVKNRKRYVDSSKRKA